MINHLKIRRNITLFKLNYFCYFCMPIAALIIVYFQSITKSYATALSIFSIATIIQVLGEVPTGMLSDRVGRRMTMIAVAFCSVLAFLCFALAGHFGSYFLFIGAFLWGTADAFVSGTDEALIYDTMQELRKPDKYDIVFSKSKSFSPLGSAAGSLIAICIVYFYSLQVLAWVTVIPAVVELIVCCCFVEPTVNSTRDVNSWEHLKHAWRNIKGNTKLQKVSLLVCVNKAVNMTSWRLEGVYFSQLIAKWLVDFVMILRHLYGSISYSISPFFRKFGFFRMIIFSTFGNALVRTIGMIINNAVSPFIFSLYGLFIGTTETAESALLQKEFSTAQRATMGSLISVLGGLIMALCYYVFGVIADVWSVYTALILLIIIRLCIGLCYTRLVRRT